MAEKKLTPLQEAIESMKTMREDANLPAFKGGISKCIEKLSLLLPKEKEFANEMWENGGDQENPVRSVRVNGEMKANWTFNDFFKQYEP